jgi:hypothetical protein
VGRGVFGCDLVELDQEGVIVIPRFCYKNKGFEGKKDQDHNYSSSQPGPGTQCGVGAVVPYIHTAFYVIISTIYFYYYYDPL